MEVLAILSGNKTYTEPQVLIYLIIEGINIALTRIRESLYHPTLIKSMMGTLQGR